MVSLLVFAFFLGPVLGIRLKDLYPFGDQAGDTPMGKNDDGSSPEIPISTLFPFFNHQHSKLIVNTNGVISFLRPVSTYTPNPFPIPNDARMIALFWADIDTTNGGTVWYRETTNDDLLGRATDEVRTYFPKFFKFMASWAFIATWDKVAFFGCSGDGCIKTNTFQAVLVTNGQHSFTIYNFEDVQWTTGSSSGGDSTTGLGGTPAQVGFNAGDGIVSFTVNASRSPDIVNVDEDSNVEIPGKFAFRIDTSDISDGGCNTKGKLTIAPRYGPMLGGQYLIISGPCIEPNSTIEVSFSESHHETCERKSDFSFACITPLFSHTGDTRVKADIRNQEGVSRTFLGKYTVLNPADSKHRVYRHDAADWSSGLQKISWDPEVAELKDDDSVDIHLFYIMENNDRHLLWEREVLDEAVERRLGSTNVTLRGNGNVMAIRVTSPTSKNNQLKVKVLTRVDFLSWVNNFCSNNGFHLLSQRGVWSDIFPLALPFKEAYQSCKNWLNSEAHLPLLPTDDVQPCPCTLDQALLDIVRFQPDPDCNIFNKIPKFSRTGNCLHRRDATHCIRLAQIGPDGIDNLCCYDADKNLIDSRLKEGGSLQRYHYLGGPGVLPYLSNFYFDVIPFLHCCRYSQNIIKAANLCPQYTKERKYSSCVNYEPPRPARTNGDPHITTLDGYSYTFNGVGEFVYLKTIDGTFQSQIRFEQFRKENGDLVDASVCTAFVSQYFGTSGSDIVEIRLNSIRTADLLINGDVIDFEESNVHQFPGIFIVQMTPNQPHLNTTKREFIVSFAEIGIAFRAIASPVVLNILPVVGNKSLAGSLRGLLGDFDENPDNDMRTPSEEILSTNSTMERIHFDFGLSWGITENISLFSYEPGKSFNDYHLPRFRPTFLLPTSLPPEVVEVCGTNRECAFDFTLTDSVEFATETVEFIVIFNSSLAASNKQKNCEDLPSIIGGVWNATNTLEGSSATLSCFTGYEASQKIFEIICSNGSWGYLDHINCIPIVRTSTTMTTKEVTSTVELLTEPTSSMGTSTPLDKIDNGLEGGSSHIYVITICVVVLVLIIIVIIAVVSYRLRKNNRRQEATQYSFGKLSYLNGYSIYDY